MFVNTEGQKDQSKGTDNVEFEIGDEDLYPDYEEAKDYKQRHKAGENYVRKVLDDIYSANVVNMVKDWRREQDTLVGQGGRVSEQGITESSASCFEADLLEAVYHNIYEVFVIHYEPDEKPVLENSRNKGFHVVAITEIKDHGKDKVYQYKHTEKPLCVTVDETYPVCKSSGETIEKTCKYPYIRCHVILLKFCAAFCISRPG
ncbi:MAG: hypothetical protein A4E63_00515 [Syntrophorhabdus sp. PtaU1.Bin050]|nr:MAG: hypothetical protein A4E63_00515 [Syntrophorhabdus sp. PtaU1.Bin050]